MDRLWTRRVHYDDCDEFLLTDIDSAISFLIKVRGEHPDAILEVESSYGDYYGISIYSRIYESDEQFELRKEKERKDRLAKKKSLETKIAKLQEDLKSYDSKNS